MSVYVSTFSKNFNRALFTSKESAAAVVVVVVVLFVCLIFFVCLLFCGRGGKFK